MENIKTVDQQYLNVIQNILDHGQINLNERTGTGTKSIFGSTIDIISTASAFPLILSKDTWFKGVIIELLWFLGNHMEDPQYRKLPYTNIRYMLDHKVYIWVGDLLKKYNSTAKTELSEEEFIHLVRASDDFAIAHGNIGEGYGWQWRYFGGDYTKYIADGNKKGFEWANNKLRIGGYKGVDQIQELIDGLKADPQGRRHMVTAWNPNSTKKTVLPPCHYGFSMYCRTLSIQERSAIFFSRMTDAEVVAPSHARFDEAGIPRYGLQLMERQRSVDTMLGLPFNIASYGVLLLLLSYEVNMASERLIMSLENTHIYLNHFDGVTQMMKEIVKNAKEDLTYPTLHINKKAHIRDYVVSDFSIEGYSPLSKVHFPLSN